MLIYIITDYTSKIHFNKLIVKMLLTYKMNERTMFSYSNRINTVSIDFCRLYQMRLREMRKGDNYVQDDGRYAKKSRF